MSWQPNEKGAEPPSGWQPLSEPARRRESSNMEWLPRSLGGWAALVVLGLLVFGLLSSWLDILG